jgi:hypothetical protein
MRDRDMTLAQRRESFDRSIAPGLAAEALGGAVERFTEATRRLTTRASWFTRGERLAAIAGPHDDERDVDLALAYGLFHAGHRQLVVIVPSEEQASRPTLARAPWITHPLQVWTYDLTAAEQGHSPSLAQRAIDPPSQMLRRFVEEWHYGADAADPPTDLAALLGERVVWVERLTTWAENDDDLAAAHRQGYLAWHCRGGLVLKVAPTRRGVRLSGGIHYSDPSKQPQPIELTEPLTSAQAHRLVGQAALAAATLLDGDDGGRREHRLQAALAKMKPLPMGLTETLRREYPAWRPYLKPRGRSYIDFLGCDAEHRLRVIETKIGDDPMLVLQGLDYWIWAMANRAELARRFHLPATAPQVTIEFLVSKTASGKPAVGPYTPSQSAALAPDVSHTFTEVAGWESEKPILKPLLLARVDGPLPEPTPSSPCAAARPAAAGKLSATRRTTRQAPPDQPPHRR